MKVKLPAFIAKLFRTTAAKEAVEVVITATQQAIALLMSLPIAQVIRDDIQTMNTGSMSGQQKFDVVLGKTLPVLVNLLKDHGLEVLVKDVEDIGRGLVQAIYNETASTRAGGIAIRILALFGIR